jgi:hypothetical protein
LEAIPFLFIPVGLGLLETLTEMVACMLGIVERTVLPLKPVSIQTPIWLQV